MQALGPCDHPHQGAEDGHRAHGKAKLKILKIDYPTYPVATFRSKYINDQALPLLIEEALEIQSPNVETISGATDVTVSFKQSLQGRSWRPRRCSAPVAELPGIRRVEMIMGMPIVVDVRDDDAGDELLDPVFDWFREVDAVFSTYKDDSEISRLEPRRARAARMPAGRALGDRALPRLAEETEGYFDAEAVVPGTIDPSGLVKGWSVDRAAALLDEAGARDYAVNAGGDIRLRGGARPEQRWRVGIQHPRIRDRIAAVVEGDDLAVATSGEYARGAHIVDPHTGRPPQGLLSVTITGPDLATADAYATAAFAMGTDGPEWTRGLRPTRR